MKKVILLLTLTSALLSACAATISRNEESPSRVPAAEPATPVQIVADKWAQSDSLIYAMSTDYIEALGASIEIFPSAAGTFVLFSGMGGTSDFVLNRNRASCAQGECTEMPGEIYQMKLAEMGLIVSNGQTDGNSKAYAVNISYNKQATYLKNSQGSDLKLQLLVQTKSFGKSKLGETKTALLISDGAQSTTYPMHFGLVSTKRIGPAGDGN